MKKTLNQAWYVYVGIGAILVGLVLRFWQITVNQFFFYDEGMYLGYNRNFLNTVANNFPKDLGEFFLILGLMIKAALSTAKALWFFLLNLRVFILGPEAWYFARVVSALAAVGTIAVTSLFAYRYFQSKRIAFLTAILLSLLPSHVFYSRLGMQESFSTLLFIAAIYIYVFYVGGKWSTVITATLLSCVFLTNYRMIIGPIFIVAIEGFKAIKTPKAFNWNRLAICLGVFALIVFITGSLYGGINRYVTFGWMFHQAQEAQGQRSFLNFFSFPLYLFILEGIFFALLFWSNLWLLYKKEGAKLLPFLLVLLQMAIFSLAAEKGARYLCVVLPFMAMAAAVAVDYFMNQFKQNRVYIIVITTAVALSMLYQCVRLVSAPNDYSKAVQIVMSHDPKAGILSTQPLVLQLYVPNEKAVQDCPKNLGDFIKLYKMGYRYFILDPQIYLSWTKDAHRFSPPLIDFLENIKEHVKPVVTLNHLNDVALERFVWDHNQNIVKSAQFLQEAPSKGYGQIRVYDILDCLAFLQRQAMELSAGR